jgi:hypothetical protein
LFSAFVSWCIYHYVLPSKASKITPIFFLVNREFADPIVAERTLEFLVANKTKILSSFPTLIPQVHTREMITYTEIVNNACRSRLLQVMLLQSIAFKYINVSIKLPCLFLKHIYNLSLLFIFSKLIEAC